MTAINPNLIAARNASRMLEDARANARRTQIIAESALYALERGDIDLQQFARAEQEHRSACLDVDHWLRRESIHWDNAAIS